MNTSSNHPAYFFIFLFLFCAVQTSFGQWEQLQAPYFSPPQFSMDTLMLRLNVNIGGNTICRSTDGGKNWKIVYTYPESQPYFASFQEADGHIYAFASSRLLVSADNGATFQDYANQPQLDGYQAKAVWRDTVLAVKILETKIRRYFPDGGYDDVPVGGTPVSYIQSVWRTGDRMFIWSNGKIYFTTDGGATWFPATMPSLPAGNFNEGIIAPSGNRIFALYKTTIGNSALLRSDDQGETWYNDMSSFSAGMCRMDQLRSNDVALFMWAAYSTPPCTAIDGTKGNTWRLPHDSDIWERDTFYFGNPPDIENDTLIAIGNYHSLDGGANWLAYPPANYNYDIRNFHAWPDDPPVFQTTHGIFYRSDTTAPFNLIDPVGGESGFSHGDTVFLFQDKWLLSTNRGATFINIPPSNPPFTPYYGTWGAGGLCIFTAYPVNNMYSSHLLQWSFETMDWTEIPLPVNTKNAILWDGVAYAVLETGPPIVMISTDGGMNWLPSSNGINQSGYLTKIYAFDDKIITSGYTSTLEEVTYISDNKGITWYPASNFTAPAPGSGYSTSFFSANGQLYAVGGNNPFFTSSDDNGRNWYPVTDEPSNIGLPTRLIGNYIYTLGDGFRRRPLSDAGLNKTKVTAVLDLNNNGIADPNEPPLANLVVCSDNGYDCALTDSSGSAFIAFSVTGDTLRPGTLPFSTFAPAFHLIDQADSTYVFAVTKENHNDITVHLNNNSAPRPGFKSYYQVQYENSGNSVQGLDVQLTLDAKLEFQTAAPPPDQVTNNTLTWHIDPVLPLSKGQIYILCKLPSTASIGDTLESVAEVIPDSLDFNLADNIDTLLEIIVGAFDPNDKQVFPTGSISPMEVSEGKRLTYTVRFQNTGTYPAENVLIIDTLAPELDIQTFSFIASSHPCAVKLDQGDMLHFYFGDIQLPDSSSNEPASHGFVEFSIEAKRDLPEGSLIKNDGHIYFDYNAPIATNTVETEVKTVVSTNSLPETGFAFSVSPNPASGSLQLVIDGQAVGEGHFELWDITGRMLTSIPFTKKQTGRAQYTITPSGLHSGTYIVACVWNDNRRETLKVFWSE